MTDNPYDALGINKDATHDEVRDAYRAKVKATHPDAGGSADEFSRVKAAAVILLDPDKRKQFDEEGTIASDRPDNLMANAIENIATFFVNSINAAIQNNMPMGSLDLVMGGERWFQGKVAECQRQISDVERQIKGFERAIKRLKTKRPNDVIKTMLTHHANGLKNHIENNKEQIKVFTKAVEILREYEFEAEQHPHVDPFLRLSQWTIR